MRLSLFRGAAYVAALMFLLAAFALGQGVTGRIQGTVVDPTGAVVAGAKVAIVNQATGYRLEVPTNQSGEYLAPNLPPGKYNVSVTANGFKVSETRDVVVIVDSLSTADFRLQVGSRSDTVQVTSAVQLVDTESSAMGNDTPISAFSAARR